MRKKSDSKNIWDVIFSLDKSCFPIQRKYLQEPRGLLNPINSQITSKICKNTVKKIKNKVTNPYDLYAYDYELNYLIRKLCDLIYYYDLDELDSWQDDSNPVSEDMVWYLDVFLNKIDFHEVEATDLRLFAEEMAYDRKDIREGKYDYNKHYSIEDSVRVINAVQYIIENSGWDWKTKAEAFLRASSIRQYNTADDETIIYLMAQNLNDEELEKEAKHRWKRYQKEWEELYFSKENPFKLKFLPNRLRLIHWDKIGSLRPLEPQLDSDPRGTYTYLSEAQHLLCPEYLADYVRVFTLFRTDLDVEPIRYQLKKLIEKFYSYLSGKHDYEYNYTVTDVYYLSDMLFAFLRNRFQNDILHDTSESFFVEKARKSIELTFKNSSAAFLANMPLVSLIAMEVHSIYYSGAEGMIPFLQKARKWLLGQQTPYGYWYDGINNPEYTTVLVLDALKLIDGEPELSFPIKTNPKYDQEKNYSAKPIMMVHFFTRSLKISDKEILFNFEHNSGSKTWDFICELMTCKVSKLYSLKIKQGRKSWKQQYDTLRNMFAKQLAIEKKDASKLLKHFIHSDGTTYRFTDYVKIDAGSSMDIRPTRQ